MMLLSYFPTRWKVHILIPIAVNIAVGISLLQRVTVGKVIESFAEAERLSLLLRAAIISFPVANFISPLLASAFAIGGVDPGRIRFKLASLIISFAALTYAASRVKNNKHAVAFFLTFPLIAATSWFMLKTFGIINYPFYPTVDTQFHIAQWSLFLLIMSGVSIPIAKVAIGWGSIGTARCIMAFSMTYMMISLISIAPGYIDPHYTIRDTSKDLGRLYSGANQILSLKAEGLFNNNSLRYITKGYSLQNVETGDILVVAFPHRLAFPHRRPVKDFLEKKAYLVHSYYLYLSPEYYRLNPQATLKYPKEEVLRVFKIK
jgi:hypothetical protein